MSLILSLVMAFMLCAPAFAAAGDIILTYDLTSGGKNDIVVKTGDVITVAYSLSASQNTNVSVTQNEIYYDHNFFEFVEGSNKGSTGFTDYTTTLQTRLSGKRYVYFNTIVSHTHDTKPSEIGTFQLKVIATEGETTVASVNYEAYDINAAKYGSAAKDLHVSIGSQQTQKFTLTFNNEDGSVFKTLEVESGKAITIPAGPTKDGYTFICWSIGGDNTPYMPGDSYMPTSDVTFIPRWTQNGGSTGGSTGGGTGTGGTGSVPMSYMIMASAGVGGSITPSGYVIVPSGSSKTFSIMADSGYVVKDILVDGRSVGAVSSYTFTGVVENHTISVTFEKTTVAPVNPFVDVPDNAYYRDAVIWASGNGITTGTSAVTFDPNGVCTRAQAVTFLWRAAGRPAPKSTTMPFEDVAANAYYYDAVLWAVEQGITKGTSDTTFSPDQYCTRAHIVTFLWRARKQPTAVTPNPFVDVAANAYYITAVLWAVENGITNGTTATTFSPDASCTRAQIVTFLYRAAQ